MKKQLLLLVSALLVLSLSAQTTNRSIVNKYKKANKHELIEVIHQKWVNNSWENTAKDVYTHNEKGIRTTEETFTAQNGKWIAQQQTHFKFEENDRRIEKKVENLVDGQWVPVRSVHTTFNEKGQKTTIEYFNWENNHWVRANQYEIEYNRAGNESVRWWQKWDRTENRYLEKSKYSFTYYGNARIGSLHQKFADGQWMNKGRSQFGNNDGYHTVHQQWNNGWQNARRDQYAWNDRGQYILKIVQRWVNGAWVNSVMHVYNHDENQNIKQEIVQHFDENGYQNERTI